MRRSFTFIELIASIVITAILGTIAIDILQKVYRNYVVSRELTKLNLKTQMVLNLLSAKLQNRLKNSVIGIKCNVEDGGCKKADIQDFLPVGEIPEESNKEYRVLEWLQIDRYGRVGEWNGTLLKPGWSGLVDLIQTTQEADGNWTIVTPYSSASTIQDILGAYFQQWGVPGSDDVFGNELAVLVFGGPAGRGTLSSEFNNSYGYYIYPAEQIYGIIPNSETNWTLVQLTTNQEQVKIFQDYYILRGAAAIVPVQIKEGEYNLTYHFNYFPWKDENYTEGNVTLLADHVTEFEFKEVNGNLVIYICITTDNADLAEYNLTVCKEKVIY